MSRSSTRVARTLVTAVASAVSAHAPEASGAKEHDGRYAGFLRCDVVPGRTTRPLKVEFSMSVADGRATYERELLRADTRDRAGVTERGSGTVSPEGALELTGFARAPTYGPKIRLVGTQVWRVPGREDSKRPCTIELSRTM